MNRLDEARAATIARDRQSGPDRLGQIAPAFWHRACSKVRVLPLVFLGLALVCALISRILLFIAAIKISVGWALGIFLPFGPLFFRLNYPYEARSSMAFRLATLPCFGAYLIIGQGPMLSFALQHPPKPAPRSLYAYALEKTAASPIKHAIATVNMEELRAANTQEFQRLHKWSETLRLRKRDLLHSDTEGNRLYGIDLAQYNAALARATIERDALWPQAK